MKNPNISAVVVYRVLTFYPAMVQNERKKARRKGNKIHKTELVIPQEQRTNTLVLDHIQPAEPDTAPRLGQFMLSDEDIEPHAESTLSASSSGASSKKNMESLDKSNLVDSDVAVMDMIHYSESTFFPAEDHHNVSLNIPASQHDSQIYGESFVPLPSASLFYGDGTSFHSDHLDTLGWGPTLDLPVTLPGLLSSLHSSSTGSWSPSYSSTPQSHSSMLSSPAEAAHAPLPPDSFDTRPTIGEYCVYRNEMYTPDNLMLHRTSDLDGQRHSQHIQIPARYQRLHPASNGDSFRDRRPGSGPPKKESVGFHPYGRRPLPRSHLDPASRPWGSSYGGITASYSQGDTSTNPYALSMQHPHLLSPSGYPNSTPLTSSSNTGDHYRH
uniref:Uncharacterized protein n=1 Tax=Moniliophthora roreri TaxID=221103 RepID=A0A0W0FP50_MONRR